MTINLKKSKTINWINVFNKENPSRFTQLKGLLSACAFLVNNNYCKTVVDAPKA